MIAHAVEVGQEFNLKIAEQELCLAIDRLVERTPACERCVINDLGDFSHYENISGTTAHSGHALDTDGKLAMMVRFTLGCIDISLNDARSGLSTLM